MLQGLRWYVRLGWQPGWVGNSDVVTASGRRIFDLRNRQDGDSFIMIRYLDAEMPLVCCMSYAFLARHTNVLATNDHGHGGGDDDDDGINVLSDWQVNLVARSLCFFLSFFRPPSPPFPLPSLHKPPTSNTCSQS